jgi:imidazole glycerol-phosphate synthase subunit HisF
MLLPRIIPCLLIKDRGLVKTVKFSKPKYVGDPLNTVKIFNEKSVDEIIILDISATIENKDPNYKLIGQIAAECCMPFTYGGGIKSVDDALKIFELGVEKIALSSVVFDNPRIISDISKIVGAQSVIIVFDLKKNFFNKNYNFFTHNGTMKRKLDVTKFAKKVEELGAGEIVLNSIDKDGLMNGYNLDLINHFRNELSIPLTVLGGAGSLNHIGEIFSKFGIIGAAAGSLFVFKGKYKAVLVNYPDLDEKSKLINDYFDK